MYSTHVLTLVEIIDAEYGEEVQSLADMTDTENIGETIEHIVQRLFADGILYVHIVIILM
jgi:hypothetical protein